MRVAGLLCVQANVQGQPVKRKSLSQRWGCEGGKGKVRGSWRGVNLGQEGDESEKGSSCEDCAGGQLDLGCR